MVGREIRRNCWASDLVNNSSLGGMSRCYQFSRANAKKKLDFRYSVSYGINRYQKGKLRSETWKTY